MRLIAKLVGLLFLLLGFIGVAAAIGGMVGVWEIRGVVQQEAPQAIASVQSSLASIHEHLERAQIATGRARQGAETFHKATQAAADHLRESDIVDLKPLDVLDEEIAEKFGRAQEVIEMIESMATSISKMLSFLESSPNVSFDEFAPDGPLVSNITGAAQIMKEIGEALDEARRLVAELRERPEIAQQRIERINELAEAMYQRLTNVESSIIACDETVEAVKSKVNVVESKWPEWLRYGVLIAAGALVWLTLAQFGLLLWGNRLLRD